MFQHPCNVNTCTYDMAPYIRFTGPDAVKHTTNDILGVSLARNG